jgi:small GTP-binding protein
MQAIFKNPTGYVAQAIFKYIVIGDNATGKSNICMRLADNRYVEENPATIGVDFFSVAYGPVKINLWDSAGLERFLSITQTYFRDCCGIILVFDLTNRASFTSLTSRWMPIIALNCPANTNIMLVGNKSDRPRAVLEHEVNDLMARFSNIVGYTETSAKNNKNIQKVVSELTDSITNRIKNGETIIGVRNPEIFQTQPVGFPEACIRSGESSGYLPFELLPPLDEVAMSKCCGLFIS